MKGGARVVIGSRLRAPTKQLLEMTPAAVARLKGMLQKAPANVHGFNLGVKTRGCNGMAYTLDYCKPGEEVTAAKGGDVVEQDGIRVRIDPKAFMYVVGTRMDFIQDDIRSEFVFENPNASGTCGCGESFNVSSNVGSRV